MKKRPLPFSVFALGFLLASSAAAENMLFKGTLEVPPGSSISNYTVCLEHHEGRGQTPPSRFLKSATPGPDGAFAIEQEKSEQSYTLYVRDAAGRVLTGWPHLGKSRDFGVIKITLEGEITGLVLDPEGKPLKDMPLKLDRKLDASCSHFLDTAATRTDAAGAFRFDKLNAGPFQLRVVSDLYTHEPHTVDLAGDMNYTEIRLSKAAAITGVVKLADGRPAVDVFVRADDKPPVKTDSQGRYRIGGLGPDSYYVTAWSDILAMAGNDRVEVKVAKDDVTVKDIVVSLVGSLRLALKSEKPGVRLPEELTVELEGKGRTQTSRSFTASVTNGVAVFGKVPPGRFDLSVDKNEFGEASTSVTIESGKEAQASLTLPESFRLGGVVLDFQGKPVEDAVVMFMSTDSMRGWGGRSLHRYDRTGEDGCFLLKGLPQVEGQLHVQVEKQAPHDETIKVTETVTNRVIRLSKGLTVKGRLVDAEGRPVPGGAVKMEPKQVDRSSSFSMRFGGHDTGKSGEDGAFELPGLSNGWYTISVEAADHMGSVKPVLVTETNLNLGDLVLKKGLAIAGSVSDAEGKPVAEAKVRVTGMVKRSYVSKESETQEDGTFRVGGLPEGKFSVSISRDERGGGEVSLEDIKAGTDDLIVSLGKKIPLRIRVTDSAGQPVPDAEIDINGSESRVYISGRNEQKTDAQGLFKTELVQGTRYQIHSSKPPLLKGKAVVDLGSTSAPPAEVTLMMEKGLTVKGLVVNEAGKPMPGVFVSVQGGDDPVQTDAAGRFVLEGAEPGTARLNVHEDEEREQPLGAKRLLLARGQEPGEVRIELGVPGSVKGTVRNNKGEPVRAAHLVMYPTSDRSGVSQTYQSKTGSEGDFELEKVAPGRYMVMVMGMSEESRQPHVQQVEVKAGETATVNFPASSETGFRIGGLVTLEGNPLPRARLYLHMNATNQDEMAMAMAMYQDEVKTDEQGRYTAQVAGPGEYRLMVYQEKQAPEGEEQGEEEEQPEPEDRMPLLQYRSKLTLHAGQTNININVAGGTIQGVIEGPDGKPLAKAWVTASPQDAETTLMDYYMDSGNRTDSEGRFTLRYLPLPAYRVIATDESRENIAEEEIRPDDGKTVHTIRLKPGLLISGKVLPVGSKGEDEGMPLMVMIMDDKNHLIGGDDPSDEDGSFELSPRLKPGRYQVACVHQTLSSEVRSLDLTTNVVLQFNLKPAGEVQVELKGEAKAIAGRTIRITDAGGQEVLRIKPPEKGSFMGGMMDGVVLALTDEAGKTLIKGLPEGAYTLTVDGTKASVKVAVKSLETATATIPLSP